MAQGTLSGRCVRRRPFWVLNATGFLGPPTQKSKASSGGPKHALLLGLGPGVAPGRVACCFDSRRRLSPFSRSIFVPRWRARACSGMLGRAGHAPSKAWVRPAPKFALPAGPGRAPASSPAWQFPARSATRQVCNPPPPHTHTHKLFTIFKHTLSMGMACLVAFPTKAPDQAVRETEPSRKPLLGSLYPPRTVWRGGDGFGFSLVMAGGRRVWVPTGDGGGAKGLGCHW